MPASAQSDHPAGTVPFGASDRWDFVVADGATDRVYVAHGNRVAGVDGRAGKIVGDATATPGGTHGTGIVGGLRVTDDGEAERSASIRSRAS